MNKEEKKQRFILTLIFSSMVFFILLISILLSVGLYYLFKSIGIVDHSNAYAKSSKSSDTIKVEIGAVVSSLSFYYGEPSWNEKYTVTLSKNKNYTASGSFSFSYYSITETVYWLAEPTYCSGSIGE